MGIEGDEICHMRFLLEIGGKNGIILLVKRFVVVFKKVREQLTYEANGFRRAQGMFILNCYQTCSVQVNIRLEKAVLPNEGDSHRG